MSDPVLTVQCPECAVLLRSDDPDAHIEAHKPKTARGATVKDCKRGCCWNPLQVCGRKRECPCHTVTLPNDAPQNVLYLADHRNDVRDPNREPA